MFTALQKKLVLQYPLLWNTKFIPMLVLGLILHLIFFCIGYINGTIDFSGQINYEQEFISLLFGFLIAVLVVILWLVYYFKNNAFKSFYRKSKNALYYEWFQIFVILFLMSAFYLPFKVGKQLHEKSYFSEQEAIKRMETISMSEIFIDGYFATTEIDSVNSILKDTIIDGEEIYTNIVYKDSMVFNGKKYHEFSLINRYGASFNLVAREQDSLNDVQLKNWLQNNQKEEVEKLMQSYLRMVNEHQLKTNLTTEKWLKAVYNPPAFTNFLYIKPYFNEYESYDNYDYESNVKIAGPNFNDDGHQYSNYFVQHEVLKNKYKQVSDAYVDTFIPLELLSIFLYVALGISLLLFSFRVTSGKSWLISIVVVGVLNIIFGIITFFLSFSVTYLILVLVTFGLVKLYLFYIYRQKKSLGFSKIALNLFLWVFAGIVPILYFIIMEFFDDPNYDRLDRYYNTPQYEWMQQNVFNMVLLNFVFCVLLLFFVSRWIRNWKGIAEE